MKCMAFEPLVALYVEGDLRESERARVETHIEGCAVCRDLVDDLRESQSVFKALRQGSVNSSALSEVRQRVMNEVGDQEPAPKWVIAAHRLLFAGLRRKTAIAGVAFCIVASSFVWHTFTPEAVVPLESVQVARFEPPSVPSTAATKPVPRKVKIAEPTVEAASLGVELADSPKESRQIMVKLFTDDPDLTIYWLIDEKGD